MKFAFPSSLSRQTLRAPILSSPSRKANDPPMMEEQFPAWANEIQYWHVDDLDCAAPDEALAVCESCIAALVERLAAEDRVQNRAPEEGLTRVA